ncbi:MULTISPECIES: hypothetical protein [Pseudomonas]|uniref:hypothetical protein n=1 Tax=Pseudomonas TaxID=286 RepID=UPI001B33262F|nr:MULTISPECIES: hypothetical protein [Pseudomonas]MBP5948505.1 hypothetical protein [Pseudomonas sp. P9(2020)]MBP5968689.1 hypothetical protein [Pseudomonas iridis]MBZ9560767.1 hypothetical protein [Pseudomonas sp. P116]
MKNSLTAVIATSRPAIASALIAQGFILVSDLPKPIRLQQTPRGMLIARLS